MFKMFLRFHFVFTLLKSNTLTDYYDYRLVFICRGREVITNGKIVVRVRPDRGAI